jgi:MoxR-like ATPase
MNNKSIITVALKGNYVRATDADGNIVTGIPTRIRKRAFNEGLAIEIDGSNYNLVEMPITTITDLDDSKYAIPEEHTEVLNFIHSSYSLKPKGLSMRELKWKYLIRSAVRGKNIMMTGMSGCGKTIAAKALVTALDRPTYVFNMGATQDPRATLIGNVHFNNDKGTYMAESLFVEAIQTPDAVILLDEISRAHPDAWNILMPVLDYGQRYLRLDEKEDQATINVASGVTFVATANIGNEYTATRTIDKALLDRFTVIEMDVLNKDEEFDLLKYMFPLVNRDLLDAVSSIAHLTRVESHAENPRIDSGISTRTSVELAGLLFDGFELADAANITIYPQYDAAGGVDSERTFVKQIVQKHIDDGSAEELFTDEEVESADSTPL